MPLIRIDVIEGQHSDAELAAISDAVHRGLVDCFSVPERDRFQVITEHRRGRLVYDPAYLGVDRSDRIVIIHVLFGTGRTDQQKQGFYASVAAAIAERTSVRRQDVMIALAENARADWSFGDGVAQYLTMPRDQWK